jgi:hypothetical protein
MASPIKPFFTVGIRRVRPRCREPWIRLMYRRLCIGGRTQLADHRTAATPSEGVVAEIVCATARPQGVLPDIAGRCVRCRVRLTREAIAIGRSRGQIAPNAGVRRSPSARRRNGVSAQDNDADVIGERGVGELQHRGA